jgi:DNA-binding transcriptional MerR regulator
MKGAPDNRRLTIGAYAAATQLTAKALRLYDEQGLLRPNATDPTTGYRYYRVEQVATGRLIRALREMSLSLAQVAQVLEAPSGERPVLLRRFLQDAEQRLARERSAYQSALMMLRPHTIAAISEIEEQTIPAQRLAIFDFITTRRSFLHQALDCRAESLQQLHSVGIRVQSHSFAALIDPLTDDEGRVELFVPIDVSNDANLQGITTRHVPLRRYAAVTSTPAEMHAGFSACVDTLFDWFDRKSTPAIGYPEVVLTIEPETTKAAVRWAFYEENRGSRL